MGGWQPCVTVSEINSHGSSNGFRRGNCPGSEAHGPFNLPVFLQCLYFSIRSLEICSIFLYKIAVGLFNNHYWTCVKIWRSLFDLMLMACFHRFCRLCGAVFQALFRQWSAAGVVTPKGRKRNSLRRPHHLNVWNRLPLSFVWWAYCYNANIGNGKNCYSGLVAASCWYKALYRSFNLQSPAKLN